jgi:hypothetical protein
MWTFDDPLMTFDQVGFTFDGGVPTPLPPPTPPPPIIASNPYLWTADGYNGWSADGFTGWSADGYEPVPLALATAALALYGVNVGVLTYAYSNLVPVGYVITGFVPYLNTSYAGQYIPLVISNGIFPVPPGPPARVPNVVGMYYFDAQLAILDAGLLIAPPIPVISSTVLPQYVVSQSLPGGTEVPQQTQITITVSGFTVLQQPGIPTAVL